MNTLDIIDLASGDGDWRETFRVRAEWRASDLDRAARRGQRLPISCLCAMYQAQAAELLIWIAALPPAVREWELERMRPQLEEIRVLRERTYAMTMRELARRKDEWKDIDDDDL
jgi:hypothetical protein